MKITTTHSFLARFAILLAAALTAAASVLAADSTNPFIGHWALTIPGGGAGWLGVTEAQAKLSVSLLWGGGSVLLPVPDVKVLGEALALTRRSGGGQRSAAATNVTTETITARIDGDILKLTTVKSRSDQPEFDKAGFSGKRTPLLPPAPKLPKVKFGATIKLFNGRKIIDDQPILGCTGGAL